MQGKPASVRYKMTEDKICEPGSCTGSQAASATTVPFQRIERFSALVQRVQSCRQCPHMNGRARVFGPANGSVDSRVVFIAEAPGRLGADRWHIPLFGDQTGRNFEELLEAAGLQRDEIFITNAVVCNPRDTHGRNKSPNRQEVRSCSAHLCATLDIIQPEVVVTLGHVALRAVSLIAPHTVQLARDVGRQIPWNQRLLVPLYHPGPRACIRRPLAQQQEDFARLGRFLEKRRGTRAMGG
jgi:uracil-DNA glycosylase